MWNSRKYAAAAIAGACLAVAAATPASAWWPGYSGYYGAPYGYGAYGYSGGWPYASYGYTDYLSSGYSGCGAYDAAGWNDSSWGYDSGPAYGYASYGYAPSYGYAGYGYRRPWGRAYGCGLAAYRPRGCGYAVAYHRPAGYAVAAHQLHRPSAFAAYAPRSDRRVYAAAKHQDFAMKPAAQSKVAYRVQTLKVAHND